MARDPGSKWAPLPEAGAPDGYRKTQLIFHATGGTGSAKAIRDNWFGRSDVVVESTFIVGKSPSDPTLQMMDSTDNADANYTANGRAISVEVVCTGSEPYTAWQVSECIRIGRWAAANHPIAKRICPAHDASGFGWHVMFGAPGPWTPAVGKVCPGAPAVQQLKTQIFPAIFADKAPSPGGFLMALTDTEQDDLYKRVKQLTEPGVNGKTPVTALRDLHSDIHVTQHDRAGVPADAPYPKGTAVQLWRWADGNAQVLREEVAAYGAALDKLADAVASQQGIDADELKATIREAIADSVVKVDVNVQGGDRPPAA